jgi:type IX secretion system PorP/SprF family membrane protein
MRSKMNMLISNTKKIMVCLLFFISLKAHAQVDYTQYMDNLTPLNPTFSLVKPGLSVNTLVRKQWMGIPGAPTTYMFDASIPLESIGSSAGIIVSNDVFAIEHVSEANAFFAKAINLSSNTKLAVSLSAGIRNYVANYSSVNSYDYVFRNDVRENAPNFGFGVMLFSTNYFIGVSVPEITIRTLGNASVEDNTNFQNHYYLTAGYVSGIGEDFKFRYVGLASYSKNVPVIADISSTMIVKDTFGIGVNLRTNKEVAGIMTINVDKFRLGYSYQFGTSPSNIGGFSNATQEVTLGFRITKNKETE